MQTIITDTLNRAFPPPITSEYEQGYRDALESLILALHAEGMTLPPNALETVLDAYGNNA